MIFKNLLRRKTRTALTILGISVGVSAIIALGTLARGLEAGYGAMLQGSNADFVLSQPDMIDISYSSIEATVEDDLAQLPEVARASGMIQGFLPAEGSLYFFVFGYPTDSFILDRFAIVDGVGFDSPEASRARGDPILIGSGASEVLNKDVGETLRLGESVFRVIGIYETGDAFEDSGAVLPLPFAQEVLGKPRQVSLVYIQLEDPALGSKLESRVARLWPDLSLSTTDDFADSQLIGDSLEASVWVIAGLAIVIGGVGMTNSQMMAVFERTREIGVLRAVGWSRWQVMRLILGESLLVGIAGGVVGTLLGWLMLVATADAIQVFGAEPTNVSAGLIMQALTTVLLLGVVGGVYPAWRASQLQPLEALRYEGGSAAQSADRLPIGGMAVQSLWQRKGRTLLTLITIGLTVGALVVLEGVLDGVAETMTTMFASGGTEVMVRQADISDTSLSAIDERIGSRIEAMPNVRTTSGVIFNALMDPEGNSFLIILGYSPHEYAIERFNVVEGEPIQASHQVMIGRVLAEAGDRQVGDTMEVSGARFRIVGIYETGVGWEDMGAVISLREAQALAGRPSKVSLLAVKLDDPNEAQSVVDRINATIPEVHAALAGEFVDDLPDMQAGEVMIDGISVLAVLVGGLGVLNTMLMAVFERTREIGVLRTMGWRRRRIVWMIVQESLLLGLIGGIAGTLIAFGMAFLLTSAPLVGDVMEVRWSLGIFLRAGLIAMLLGLVGGLYPAFRASGMQPVEALRYE